MFLSRNKKKNNVYPCKPQFYYIKVGFKGVKIIKQCFRDGTINVSEVNIPRIVFRKIIQTIDIKAKLRMFRQTDKQMNIYSHGE